MGVFVWKQIWKCELMAADGGPPFAADASYTAQQCIQLFLAALLPATFAAA
jgi:hypothetical protein